MHGKSWPAGLSPQIATPLVQAAGRVAALKPWEYMSDLYLIGLRDDNTRELQVASVLGTLREVFAVVIYRNAAGLRWIHAMATEHGPCDPDAQLEALDFLKVEWTGKRELKKTDSETLAAGGFKPTGKGKVWPRFESTQPGWYPWFPSPAEAQLLTAHLGKVARLAHLARRMPDLYSNHLRSEIPIIPGGDESTLNAEELEWLPFLPPPATKPEPVSLSQEEAAPLSALPPRQEAVFELMAPLMPEMSFMDEAAGRPCIARVGLMVDRDSHMILSAGLTHGAAPLAQSLKRALLEGLRAAGTRPGAIHVLSEDTAFALEPACQNLGVRVRVTARLDSANEAMDDLTNRFRRR